MERERNERLYWKEDIEGIIWGYEGLGRVKWKREGFEIGDDVYIGMIEVLEKFCYKRR